MSRKIQRLMYHKKYFSSVTMTHKTQKSLIRRTFLIFTVTSSRASQYFLCVDIEI